MFRHPGAGGREGRERDEKERRENADELLDWMCSFFLVFLRDPRTSIVQI